MKKKMATLVSPTEKRKEKAEEQREVAANACVACPAGRYGLKTVGCCVKKTIVVCDKCGARKDQA